MERLRGAPVHLRIRASMDNWLDAIKKVQTKRREELINSSSRHPMFYMANDKGVFDFLPVNFLSIPQK